MATKAKLGAGAETDIDRVGGESLLQPGAAGESRDLELEPVLLEEAFGHADIERREIEGQGDRLAGAQLVERRCRRRRYDDAERGESRDNELIFSDAKRASTILPESVLLIHTDLTASVPRLRLQGKREALTHTSRSRANLAFFWMNSKRSSGLRPIRLSTSSTVVLKSSLAFWPRQLHAQQACASSGPWSCL